MTRKAANFNHEHCECVAGLEHDLADLKRRLGEREPSERKGRKREDDWLANLPNADRKYFERKLGTKK